MFNKNPRKSLSSRPMDSCSSHYILSRFLHHWTTNLSLILQFIILSSGSINIVIYFKAFLYFNVYQNRSHPVFLMNLFIPVAFIEHQKVKATLSFFRIWKITLLHENKLQEHKKQMLHNSALKSNLPQCFPTSTLQTKCASWV